MTQNQIAYWNYVETKRNNLAQVTETNRANLARENETNRANLAREKETYRNNVAVLNETKRSNLARETETKRNNVANLLETNRHNLATEALSASAQEISRAELAERQRSNMAQEEIGRLNAASNARQAQAALSSAQAAQVSAAANRQNASTNLRNAVEQNRANLQREAQQRAELTNLQRNQYLTRQETKRANLANESIARSSAEIKAGEALSGLAGLILRKGKR